MERSLSNPDYYSPKDAYKRTTALIRLDKYFQKSMDPPENLLWVLKTLEGPEKFALIISDLSQQLAAMARYERRAFSRRKFAIRAFDKAARELVMPPETAGKATSSGLVRREGSYYFVTSGPARAAARIRRIASEVMG